MSPAVDPAPRIPACPRCGAALRADQDWCLECGAAATTRVLAPPSWKVPLLVILAVVVVFAAVVAIAYALLSHDANKSVADVPAGSRHPASAPASPAPASPASGAAAGATGPTGASGAAANAGPTGATGPAGAAPAAAVPRWPAGEQGYSVVLLSTADKQGAEREARKLIRTGDAPDAGILASSRYDFFSPDLWIVFAGRYADKRAADRAATRLKRAGHDGYVTLVRERR